ncbi:Histone-lysine N-methyltransferase PR-Set7 [Frankliniella fusca]|uniref:[histone H4]-lysine(20) N-methyltransferase n=1 Tax=Frankliniella fusca TaxID=407009 RepID=A0AAE1LG83_9NEOP|nr:Histone-lysine N-methyltransferase PR-Set7 [Frankliniella fusca]
MRGKRKGRGGRRGPPSAGDLPSDSPKRKDSRVEFQGLLSHASPPITKFFHPKSKELTCAEEHDLLKESEALDRLTAENSGNPTVAVCVEETPPVINAAVSEDKPVEVSDIAHGTENGLEPSVRSPSPATPHKIVFDDAQPPLLSPSSALSQLSIANGALRKVTKSRRKLNPNQTANQLAPPTSAGSKLSCCTKAKPSSVNDTNKAVPATATTNGSQHKLTDFFPVRRSIRKTKKTVLEERQKTLEEAVLMCKEEGLQIHNFEGKGRGIVAVRSFVKGEFVVEYAGELIKMDEAKEREKLYAQDQNTGCYMYYFKHKNQQLCVDATPESNRLGRLVNHSRNGNLLTKTITINDMPRLVLIAKEDIQPGEEVTYDYGDRSKESLKYHPWLAS